jgi:hypothetical protein
MKDPRIVAYLGHMLQAITRIDGYVMGPPRKHFSPIRSSKMR